MYERTKSKKTKLFFGCWNKPQGVNIHDIKHGSTALKCANVKSKIDINFPIKGLSTHEGSKLTVTYTQRLLIPPRKSWVLLSLWLCKDFGARFKGGFLFSGALIQCSY